MAGQAEKKRAAKEQSMGVVYLYALVLINIIYVVTRLVLPMIGVEWFALADDLYSTATISGAVLFTWVSLLG